MLFVLELCAAVYSERLKNIVVYINLASNIFCIWEKWVHEAGAHSKLRLWWFYCWKFTEIALNNTFRSHCKNIAIIINLIVQLTGSRKTVLWNWQLIKRTIHMLLDRNKTEFRHSVMTVSFFHWHYFLCHSYFC